jgi:uncharacterized protein
VVEVSLLGLQTIGPGRDPVMLLQEKAGEHRVVPIFIGRAEADSIDVAVRGEMAPRPLTHDLMTNVIGELGGVLGQVVITGLIDHVFHAELVIVLGEVSHRVSARASDAVSLALRSSTPMFMDEAVLAEAGQAPPAPAVTEGGGESQEVIDEFRSFLDSVNPDDFS